MRVIDAGMAILLGERAHLIEFPSLLLPPGATAGSIVNISVTQNFEAERVRDAAFWKLQDEILDLFGKEHPKPPELTVSMRIHCLCSMYSDEHIHSLEMLPKLPSRSNGRPYNLPRQLSEVWTSTATESAWHLSRPL